MLSLTKLTKKIVARLLDDVYVEELNDQISGKVAKLEYKGKRGYIEKKKENHYIAYYCEGDLYSWIPGGYDYGSYEDAVVGVKKILKQNG